jgi:hypothetical protein
MPWFKVSDDAPADGERVLVNDGRNDRVEVGLRVGGRWFVEGGADGRLTAVEGVTHWGPLLDSEEYDPADD